MDVPQFVYWFIVEEHLDFKILLHFTLSHGFYFSRVDAQECNFGPFVMVYLVLDKKLTN